MSRELPQPLHRLHDLDVVLPWPPRRCMAQQLQQQADELERLTERMPAAERQRLSRAYVAGWRYGVLCGAVAGGLATVGVLRLLG